ncbi:hypothetical protein Q5752_000943 [Cryptotrichosporon argae]
MAHQVYLPPQLLLVPLPRPHVLFPFLQVTLVLSRQQAEHVRASLAELPDGAMAVAAVPVADHDKRVGRWACAAVVKHIKEDADECTVTLEGVARIRLPCALPPVLSILPPLTIPSSAYTLPLPSPTSPPSLLPVASRLLPASLHPKLARLPPTLQADLLAVILGLEWDVRVELLGTPDAAERAARVEAAMLRLLAARGLPAPPTAPAPGPTSALVKRERDAAPPNTPEDVQPLYALLSTRAPELSSTAAGVVRRELARLAKLPPHGAEYGVARTYVEWLLALPWRRVSEGARVELEDARARLENEHEGLHEVKRRVVEYLAVYRLKRALWEEQRPKRVQVAEPAETDSDVDGDGGAQLVRPKQDPDVFIDKAPILLLVGPPGVGKTSIARSLAGAMGREFHRVSLGGVRDEAEIRGHRRTYVGAMPGLLVQGLRKVGVANPVVLLDELDKTSSGNFYGDPAAALLEALDPAQNWSFHDHYIGDVAIDLSQVTFVATANTLDTISAPLLDRCEVIECAGYITDEKLLIARRFLLPKQVTENGLAEGAVEMDEQVMRLLIEEHTREAGVRSLERLIAKVCRAKAVEFSKARDSGKTYSPSVTLDNVRAILGNAKYEREVTDDAGRAGVATGLAYRGSGNGGILLVETALIPSGSGKLHLTGNLEKVIRESAELALAWVKAHAHALGLVVPPNADVHVHLPAAAVKKDGPSAGVTLVVALVSLLSGRPVPPTTAFTGEVTLRGVVTAVGGIREKVLGAHRAGITRVIMPAANERDVADLPPSVGGIETRFVKDVSSALEVVWPGVFDKLAREARL